MPEVQRFSNVKILSPYENALTLKYRLCEMIDEIDAASDSPNWSQVRIEAGIPDGFDDDYLTVIRIEVDEVRDV